MYYVTTPQHLATLASAVNALCGLAQPVKGTVHGDVAFTIPDYAGPGTPGWTDSVFRGSWVSADLSQAAITVVPDMLSFSGQLVVVGDTLVEFPTEADGVAELPPALLPENGAFWWDGTPLG